jgi:hypothetical protein
MPAAGRAGSATGAGASPTPNTPIVAAMTRSRTILAPLRLKHLPHRDVNPAVAKIEQIRELPSIDWPEADSKPAKRLARLAPRAIRRRSG